MKIYSKHIVFKDIVNSLYHSLKNLSYNVSLTDKIIENDNELYILVGVAEFCDNIPSKYIVYQFEQTGVSYKNSKDIWFTDKYLKLLSNALYIWDYSNENIKYLNSEFKLYNTIYVPLRYSIVMDGAPKLTDNNKDIDVLFMGSVNDRRKKILDNLSKKYVVHIASNNLWDRERDLLVSRSKIVLNIQFYDNGILELARISYLLSNCSFIISEKGREDKLISEMENFLVFSNYKNIELLVAKYIKNSEERENKKIEFYNNWKKTNIINSIPIECFKDEQKVPIFKKKKTKKKGKIKYYIPENIKNIDFEVSNNGLCTLKLPNIDDTELPNVSIITPTKNRRFIFNLAIYNFNNFIYPKEKLEWVIIDNGEEDLTNLLPTDNRIKYIKLGSDKEYSIGEMRNLCIDKSKYDIICYMDDDDYYRPESILSRVKSLIKYSKDGVECVGCTQVGCFNIMNGQSVIGTNKAMYLSEASMAHTKRFWAERNYNNNDFYGEFKHFLLFRQSKIRAIPYQFVMIALNHHKNTTGKSRVYKNYKEWMDLNSSNKNFSFFNFFDNNVKEMILQCNS